MKDVFTWFCTNGISASLLQHLCLSVSFSPCLHFTSLFLSWMCTKYTVQKDTLKSADQTLPSGFVMRKSSFQFIKSIYCPPPPLQLAINLLPMLPLRVCLLPAGQSDPTNKLLAKSICNGLNVFRQTSNPFIIEMEYGVWDVLPLYCNCKTKPPCSALLLFLPWYFSWQ